MDWKKDRLASAVSGENPTIILQMKSGFAVLADSQFLPGYCILLGYPRSAALNELSPDARRTFLTDMCLIGDALTSVCHPLRINYEILGNTDAYLHAHIIPRYEWEPDGLRKQPVWLYPPEHRAKTEFQFNKQNYGQLIRQLREKLEYLTHRAYTESTSDSLL